MGGRIEKRLPIRRSGVLVGPPKIELEGVAQAVPVPAPGAPRPRGIDSDSAKVTLVFEVRLKELDIEGEYTPGDEATRPNGVVVIGDKVSLEERVRETYLDRFKLAHEGEDAVVVEV